MSQIDIETVADLLVDTLHNRESLARVIEARDQSDVFLATYFSSEIQLNIQQWIARAWTQEVIPAEMNPPALSMDSLLAPMANTIAELWLQETPSKLGRLYVNFYIAFLHAYQCMRDTQAINVKGGEKIPKIISVFDVDRFRHEEIYLVALRTELPRNSQWHSAVGLTLSWNNYDSEAAGLLSKAIELDHNNSAAHYGLCNSLCCLRDYVKSIEMGIAFLALEPIETPMTNSCWYWMEFAAQRLDINDRPILELARNKLGAHTKSARGISFSLKALWSQDRFADILAFVGELREQEYSQPNHNRLYQLLPDLPHNIFHYIALSAAKARQKRQVLEIIDELVQFAESANDFRRKRIAKYIQALIQFSADRMSQEGLTLFEELRSDPESGGRNISGFSFLSSINEYLGSLYFEKAMEARRSGANSWLWVEKLEETQINPSPSLARQRGRTTEAPTKSSVDLKLALWYRLEGENELCKRLLKPIFQQAIHILRDDNVHNDATGYRILAAVLFRAGNTEQAIAAFIPLLLPFSRQQSRNRNLGDEAVPYFTSSNHGSLGPDRMKQAATGVKSLEEDLRPLHIDQREIPHGESNQHSTKEASEDDLSRSATEKTFSDGLPPVLQIDTDYSTVVCAAGCTRRIIHELWVCEYCEHDWPQLMCGECLQGLKTGRFTIYGRLCERYHPYHRVYPIDEQLKDRATKNVQGRTLPREEWLRELEDNWMFPSSSGREYSNLNDSTQEASAVVSSKDEGEDEREDEKNGNK
ncbi:MAG: hypothetical protein Q9191_008203 [Dirinaria sp. TL-2023a]